jgi:capsular exopolysaccharide synthesis family protein
MGLGLGLLSGVAVAVGLEFLNDTIKTREDVRTKLQLACLGAIPKKVGKTSLIEDLKDPGSAVSEAYSAVGASLRFTTEEGVPKSLLVTSTREAEGKSSTALALAQNLARQGRTVLLIDADLRRPSFAVGSSELGLSRLLTTHDALTTQVLPTQFDNLWLVPCGPLPPNPADLLSTGRFKQLLADATRQFDHVIIDAPPVLGLADAPLLSSTSSGVLFVIESGGTRTRAAIEAINRLEASGSHLVGAVLTKSAEKESGYGYYSYRYSQLSDGRETDKALMITHEGRA